eukprot:TRINITY_DN22696_c0_g2_i1.p1 TRINITY_DN22696_c0_g2~~TRINITY_DN22696_c0_g2_i1.p1  ORF type:complete len:544 (-),score=78.70 TRINITY_DN22696_c0_g2_i1:273-1904(-)
MSLLHRKSSVLYLSAAILVLALHLPRTCLASRPSLSDEGTNAAGSNATGGPRGDTGPKSEKEKTSHSVAKGEATMFLASIPLLGLQSYLLSHRQQKVRRQATKNVSSIMVIFIAVTIEHAFNELLAFAQELTFEVKRAWLITFGSFGFWWIVTATACFFLRKNKYDFAAARDIGSHVSAFCAMHALGAVLYRFECDKTFGHRQWALLYKTFFFIGMSLPFAILVKLSGIALHNMPFNRRTAEAETVGRLPSRPRRTLTVVSHDADCDRAIDIKVFVHEVHEGYEEAALLALSYLFSKFIIQKGIIDMMDLTYTQKSFDSREQFWHLQNPEVVHACIVMLIIVVSMDFLFVATQKIKNDSISRCAQSFVSMVLAWNWMRFIRFMIMIHASDCTSIYIATAFFATPLGSVQLFVGDFLTKHGLLSEESEEERAEAFGFMVGFAWEKAYVSAISMVLSDLFAVSSDMSPEAAKLQRSKAFAANTTISSILIAVMFVAWRYLVLPYAYAFIHHNHESDEHESHEKSFGHEKSDSSLGETNGHEKSDD